MNLLYNTEGEARAALVSLGLDPATCFLYEIFSIRPGPKWTWQTHSKIDRAHKLYRTKRLAKKAMHRHPGWTVAEKRYLRPVQAVNGKWGWAAR